MNVDLFSTCVVLYQVSLLLVLSFVYVRFALLSLELVQEHSLLDAFLVLPQLLLDFLLRSDLVIVLVPLLAPTLFLLLCY